eukprot:7896542-Alexandrium_andersonii.AAC.1
MEFVGVNVVLREVLQVEHPVQEPPLVLPPPRTGSEQSPLPQCCRPEIGVFHAWLGGPHGRAEIA